MRAIPTKAGVIAFLVFAAVLRRPSPAAAECIFVPPWPAITSAIPSAEEVIVGDVVDDFDPSKLDTEDGGARTKALQITHVLRGDRVVGQLADIEWLLPNWPWAKFSSESAAIPSCSYLQALPGERIAIALDALMPGQQMHDADVTWYQPATRYNAMGVLIAVEPSEEWGAERERVTMSILQDLVALPQTDASGPYATSAPAAPWFLIVLVAVAGGLLALSRRSRDIARR